MSIEPTPPSPTLPRKGEGSLWDRLGELSAGPPRERSRLVPRLVLCLIALLAAELAVIGLDAAFPPDLGKAYRASPVALDRHGAWLRALPVEDGRWRIRADLTRTDPAFVARLVALEDSRFWLHAGVDPISVLRASASAALHG